MIMVGGASDGDTEGGVWIGGDRVAIRVEPRDGTTREIPVPIGTGRWTGLLEHDGVVWAADWIANTIVRTDALTGHQLGTTRTSSPSTLAWADGVWTASGVWGGVTRVNPVNGVAEKKFPGPRSFAVTPDGLWFLDPLTSRILIRADPATGEKTARIPLPLEIGGIGSVAAGPGGTVWVWDSGSGGTSHIATVDPTSGRAHGFVVSSNLIGGIVRVGDRMWGVVGIEAGRPARLQELGMTGPTDRVLVLPEGFDPDTPVVTADSLWIPTEHTGQVFRYPLDALR
jgi:streptogramin lyase